MSRKGTSQPRKPMNEFMACTRSAARGLVAVSGCDWRAGMPMILTLAHVPLFAVALIAGPVVAADSLRPDRTVQLPILLQ